MCLRRKAERPRTVGSPYLAKKTPFLSIIRARYSPEGCLFPALFPLLLREKANVKQRFCGSAISSGYPTNLFLSVVRAFIRYIDSILTAATRAAWNTQHSRLRHLRRSRAILLEQGRRRSENRWEETMKGPVILSNDVQTKDYQLA
jgi:hypothetical protein